MPEPNPWWDALSDAWGEPVTKTEKTNRGRICRELRDAGIDPAEITTRSAEALRRWPSASVNVLAARWSELTPRDAALRTPDSVRRSMRNLGWKDEADERGFLRWVAAGQPTLRSAG